MGNSYIPGDQSTVNMLYACQPQWEPSTSGIQMNELTQTLIKKMRNASDSQTTH